MVSTVRSASAEADLRLLTIQGQEVHLSKFMLWVTMLYIQQPLVSFDDRLRVAL